MFAGIVEKVSRLAGIEKKGDNLIFSIINPFEDSLYIDQSISHNGVCLTIIEITEDSYKVEAIKETLLKSNLGEIKIGDMINLERCIQIGARVDGHMVQGHVDCTAELVESIYQNGSWLLKFKYPIENDKLIVDKGSITINGISLTVVDAQEDWLTVAIIPYTYEHTNVKHLKPGSKVNLEFDIIGKYVIKYLQKTKA